MVILFDIDMASVFGMDKKSKKDYLKQAEGLFMCFMYRI